MSSPAVLPQNAFERLLSLLEGVRRRGPNEALAMCPAHNNTRTQALSITYKPEQRRVFVHCFTEACTEVQITAAVGLRPTDLWDLPLGECEVCGKQSIPDAAGRYLHDFCASRPTAPKRSSSKKPPSNPATQPQPTTTQKTRLPARLTSSSKKHGKPVEICRYEYIDADGTVVHGQLRKHQSVTNTRRGVSTEATAKEFLYQRPDDKGGWLDGLGDVQPLLYNLPAVLAAIAEARRVFVLEGEKDCDRLSELGEVATTNPGGAGSLRPAHVEILARAVEVWAVLDRDVAGYNRGIKLAKQLPQTPLRLFLPRTTAPHSDLSDHLDAGHALTDLVPVTVAELHRMITVDQAEGLAEDALDAAAEAEARTRRASTAANTRSQATEQGHAARWAVEAATVLAKVVKIVDVGARPGPFEPDQVQRIAQALTTAQGAARSAFEAIDGEIPASLQGLLERDGTSLLVDQQADASDDDDADADGDDDQAFGDDELAARRLQRTGEQGSPSYPPPDIELPSTRGIWRLELGGPGRGERGVYEFRSQQGGWLLRAPIPVIHERVVSKDGRGNHLGVWYVVSATADSAKVMIGYEHLQRGTWPTMLDMSVSLDDRILKLASTGIVFAAKRETDLREATPIADEHGTIAVPPVFTMPAGYMALAPIDRAEALRLWAQVVHLAAPVPKLALIYGATAFGSWISPMDVQSHVIAVHGDQGQGKSTALRSAASMFGFPGTRSKTGVVTTWNASKLAPAAHLGELGCLPAFFDETGTEAKMSGAEWGARILSICEGASRLRPANNGAPGTVRGRTWYGVLLTAGTERILAGVGAGGAAGVHRRVIELEAPFTLSGSHADEIDKASRIGYGHLGAELLARNNIETVTRYLTVAADLLGDDAAPGPSVVKTELAKLLICHVAGAAMIDDICGTGVTLQSAAALAALEYLEEWQQPPHDADLVYDKALGTQFAQPASWPKREAYEENAKPRREVSYDISVIAGHGIDRTIYGFEEPDEGWFAIEPSVWSAWCDELKADSSNAARELLRRGVLIRAKDDRGYQTQIKIAGKRRRFYKLRFPVDQPEPVRIDIPDQPPVPTPVPTETGPVPTPVPTPNVPLTRAVPTVPTVPTPPTRIGAREARFTAPAAVLDGQEIELIGGRVAVSSEFRHLGDVANLTRTYRLGWGGGEDRLPDEGQVWLTAATLQRLGLPVHLDVPVDPFQPRADWRANVRKAFESIAKLPAIADAVAAGWQISQVDAWTRLWHPEHRGGAWIVVPSWFRIEGVSLLSTDPDDDGLALLGNDLPSPAVLVRRLHEFALQLGVSYRITPAATGLDLIDWTRPPRRDASDSKGAGRRRVAVVRGESELPDFFSTDKDRRRFSTMEQDFSWWRPWNTLIGSERECTYAVAYDRGRSYLSPWSSLRLGVEGLTHTTEAVWDGSEKPGYWLIDRDWAKDWPWWLPSLMKASGIGVDDGMWVTTPTLRQMQAVGITPTVRESWTWSTEARYLEPASDALRRALADSRDPAVVQTLKAMFAATVGKLGQIERPRGRGAHLDRPDWRHHIIASSRLGIQHTLMKAHDLTGAIPLVVDRDTIVFASNDNDPAKAWPGDPTKLGTGIGAWKPAGIAPLAEWGPRFLPDQRLHHRWNYDGLLTMSEWQ